MARLVKQFKKLNFGCPFGAPEGVVPPNYAKIIVCLISADIKTKNWQPRLSQTKNGFSGDPFEGISRGMVPLNYVKIFV